MIDPIVDTEQDRIKYARLCLKQYGKLYGVSRLAKSDAALNLILYFAVSADLSVVGGLIKGKSNELACVLWSIGMDYDPGQFGKNALASTQLYLGDDDTDIEATGNRPVGLALEHLVKAAKLMDLPHDYYVKRKDFSYIDMVDKSGIIADCRPEFVVDPTFRPPAIENYHNTPYRLSNEQAGKLWALTDVSCLVDFSNRENQDFGKRSGRSVDMAAVRRLAREIDLDRHFLQREPEMRNPFATVRDVLRLINLDIETKHIAQTLKRELS